MIYYFLVFFIGNVLGFTWRELWGVYRRLERFILDSQPKAKPGVTAGAYKPANENSQTTHIVSPKSPQRIEWELQQAIKEDAGVAEIIDRTLNPR